MRGWILSIVGHAVLLPLGFSAVRERVVPEESSDFACSFRAPGPTLDHLTRIGDFSAWTVGDLDAALPKSEPDEDFTGPLPNPGWYVLVLDDGISYCATWVRQLFQEYQGRVVVVRRSEYLRLLRPPNSFADRLSSLWNNRSGRPRLKRTDVH
jgi:hypothetical protein